MTGILVALVILVTFSISFLFAPTGWRTRVFNWASGIASGVVTIIGYVLPALDGADFSGFLTTKEAALAGFLIFAGNAILREVTKSPAGKPL